MINNPDEVTIELKKYLRKLIAVLEYEAKFTLLSTKLIDKRRIDDVLCCVESSWPEDYKTYIKNFDSKKLKSPFYYKQALAMIKNKFFFSTDVYSVNYKEAILSLRMIMQTIDTDMVYIYSDQSGM